MAYPPQLAAHEAPEEAGAIPANPAPPRPAEEPYHTCIAAPLCSRSATMGASRNSASGMARELLYGSSCGGTAPSGTSLGAPLPRGTAARRARRSASIQGTRRDQGQTSFVLVFLGLDDCPPTAGELHQVLPVCVM